MQNDIPAESSALGNAYERGPERPTESLSMFLDEVMELIDGIITHLEKGTHDSPTADRAFKYHGRVLKTDGDGWEAENNRELLRHLRETYTKRQENHRALLRLLQQTESLRSPTAEWLVSSLPLDEFGLAGADLAMKLRGWFGALKNFLNSGSKKALEKALQWANTILGSLAAVTLSTTIGNAMGTVAEPIKEMKDVLHTLYN